MIRVLRQPDLEIKPQKLVLGSKKRFTWMQQMPNHLLLPLERQKVEQRFLLDGKLTAWIIDALFIITRPRLKQLMMSGLKMRITFKILCFSQDLP